MRTACTKYGRTDGDICIKSLPLVFFAEYYLLYFALEVFSLKSEKLLALYFNAVFAAMRLYDIVKLLNYIKHLYLRGKILYQLYGQRIYHAEL